MEDDTTQVSGGTAELLRGSQTSPNDTNLRTNEADASTTQDRELIHDNRPDEVSLLSKEKSRGFTERWEECQRDFVDEPRHSVEMADELVADLVRDLAQQFADERANLEGQWSRGEEVSTDDLRFALQRYRSFFNRLLKV